MWVGGGAAYASGISSEYTNFAVRTSDFSFSLFSAVCYQRSSDDDNNNNNKDKNHRQERVILGSVVVYTKYVSSIPTYAKTV